MFVGHYAVAFGAKRAAPRVSLGILFAATSLIDLLWPIFLSLGWERARIEPGNTMVTPLAFVHYPWTHSLVGAAVWAALFALLYWLVTRYAGGTLVVGLVTISHWLLDAFVHRPDLPIFPGSSYLVGLGLWNSVSGTVLVEGGLFIAGVWLYASNTNARDAVGRYGFWCLVCFLVLIYAANLFGPPPPSVDAVAFAGLAAWLLPFWAEWFDRRRFSNGTEAHVTA